MRESFYGPDEAIKYPLLNPAEKHNQTLCNTHTQKETHCHANDRLYLPGGPSTSHSSLRAHGPPIFRAGEERGAGTVQEPLIITQYKREKKPTGNTHSPKYTQITTALRFIHTHTPSQTHKTHITSHSLRATDRVSPIHHRGRTLCWMGEVIFLLGPEERKIILIICATYKASGRLCRHRYCTALTSTCR